MIQLFLFSIQTPHVSRSLIRVVIESCNPCTASCRSVSVSESNSSTFILLSLLAGEVLSGTTGEGADDDAAAAGEGADDDALEDDEFDVNELMRLFIFSLTSLDF